MPTIDVEYPEGVTGGLRGGMLGGGGCSSPLKKQNGANLEAFVQIEAGTLSADTRKVTHSTA